MIYKIPTWNKGEWTYTIFYNREKFRVFVKTLFKEPGLYNFDDTSFEFNKHATKFNRDKLFCEAPEDSRDYVDYWDTEKEKCRKGVIYKNDKGDIWYLPRFYYHWINFLQIYDKRPEVKKFVFPDVRDVQYHMSLYECLAELYEKNSCILKSRQKASSYFHIAKLYNKYIFEQGFVGKIGASDKKYINKTKGSWKFLNQYHNFTNNSTAWACSNLPDTEFAWEQKVETKTTDGRKVQIGLMSTITGVSFDKDPISAVGGATDEFFYEEGGIAPTADLTYGYIMEAMREGATITGHFTIAGSVGSLDQCKPLEKFIKDPIGNDFYPVNTTLLDENGTPAVTGLFIPEQWGMIPYIDKFGNSMVQDALDYLNTTYEQIKKDKGYTDYQLRVSQRPRNINEALAIRTVSIFPVKHTTKQIKRIEDGEYHIKYVDLEYNDEHVLYEKKSDRFPIIEFPISMNTKDKRGVLCIHESPIRGGDGKVPWNTYYASVDPVEKGKVITTDSLFSIHVYKNPVEVTHVDDEGNTSVYLEGDKLVAWWCGRYDDVNETNEHAWKIVQYYNAWTLSENQKTSFINYVIANKGTKYLVGKNDVLFDKELENKQNVHDAFGWSKNTKLWEIMMEYGVSYLSEVLDIQYVPTTDTVLKTVYGVTRIPDIMLLKEMQQYQEKGNYDRIISYVSLIAFAKKQQAERGVRKIVRKDDTAKESKKIPNFDRGMHLQSVGRAANSIKNYRGKTFKSIR